MITTIKFRLHPTPTQEVKLHEIFKIYNKAKRITYKTAFQLKDVDLLEKEKINVVYHKAMYSCQNSTYSNSIQIDCSTRIKQQETWLGKQENDLNNRIKVITKKINNIKYNFMGCNL